MLDGHRRLSIHSVFGSAVNVRAGHRLVNCSMGVISLPNGIEMTPADLRRLQRLPSRDALGWRPVDRVMTSRTGEVLTAWTPRTVVFDTALPTGRGEGLPASASALVAHLARVRARTGIGEDWLALTTDPALTGAVVSLARGRVDDAVTRWVGRGPGLTPSGDDLLVGMLVALQFSGVVDALGLAPFREWARTDARRLTTEISAEHLYHASRGTASGAVCDLLLALDRPSTAEALDAVDRLRRYGHTSGMDCVLGVALGLLAPEAKRSRAPGPRWEPGDRRPAPAGA